MDIDFDSGESKKNIFGDSYYPLVNSNVFTNNSSKTVFDKYLNDTFVAEDTLYIIIGTDSGLLPSYLKNKFTKNRQGRKFIFIDYASVAEAIDFSEFPEWIECYTTSFYLGALSSLEVEFIASKKVSLVKSLAVIDAKYNQPYDEIWNHFEQEYTDLWFSDVASATKSFIHTQLLNIHRNIKPIKSIKGCLEGKNVLLIGGGPSFDDTLEWVKQHQYNLIVIAAGRMASKLIQESIIPDFYVSVDPYNASFDNAKKILFSSKGCILLNAYHISPLLLNEWEHNNTYFGELLPWGDSSENSSAPGPTVMHSALHQVVFLGAKKVYLTGVDMCFKGSKTHASGNIEDQFDNKIGMTNLKQVETYSGSMAETDQAFSSGVIALESLVKSYQDYAPDCAIYNLSQDAAKVAGIEYQTLDNICLNKDTSIFIMKSINKLLYVSKEEYQQFFKLQLKVIQKKRLLLKDSLSIANLGTKQVKGYTENKSNSNKVIKLRKKLDKQLKDMEETIYQYGRSYFKEAFKPLDDKNNMSKEEAISTFGIYFVAASKSITDFVSQLDNSIVILKRRQEEFAEHSSPSKLLYSWKNNFEMGRYRIWQHYNPDATLTQLDKEALATAKAWFEIKINNEDTAHASFLKGRGTAVKDLFSKVITSYEKQNTTEFEAINKQLTLIGSGDARQLEILITGLEADLNKNEGIAVESYKQISCKPMLPFVLKRLLQLAMNREDHEQALINLEQLCNFSLDYMVLYADYLAMLGQLELAQTVLQQYIQLHPDNVSALLKLAELSLKRGLKDDALLALKQAEALDENNPQLIKMIGICESSQQG